jgi:hypothetical protein
LQQLIFQVGYILDVVEAAGPFPLFFRCAVWERGSIDVINFRRLTTHNGGEIGNIWFYGRSVIVVHLS